MPPETEVIKQQMSQTRSALTEKMEALENKVLGTVHDTTSQVMGTVQDTTHAVSGTVQEVGATVRETAHDVRATIREALSSVRDTLDVTQQMEHHPWVLLGGSVFAGYVGGRILDNLERGRLPSLPALPASPEQLLPEGSELRQRMEAEALRAVPLPPFSKRWPTPLRRR